MIYIDGQNLYELALSPLVFVDPYGQGIEFVGSSPEMNQIQQELNNLEYSPEAEAAMIDLSTPEDGHLENTQNIHVMTPAQKAQFEAQEGRPVTGATLPHTDEDGNATGDVDIYIWPGSPGQMRQSLGHEIQHAQDFEDRQGDSIQEIKNDTYGNTARHREIRRNSKEWSKKAMELKKFYNALKWVYSLGDLIPS